MSYEKIAKNSFGCKRSDRFGDSRAQLFLPKVNGKRMARNVYANTKEACEEKLAVMIREMKAEIAEMKAAANT